MPKSKNSRYVMVTRWVASVQDYYIIADEGIVYCKACNKEIRCERKSQVRQHVNTAVHKRNVEERNRVTASSDVQANSSRKCQFHMDMCQAMIAANMPWQCLDNKTWRKFLQKYTNQYIPNESILKKNYLGECYNLAIKNIQKNIADDYVWISVHETRDSITNLMIGKLNENERTQPYLLACNRLQEANDATIARFVNSAIRVLWPNGEEEKILLFITDATPYMLEAGNHLKVFYPNILHVTCLASELNRVAEKVRLHFPSVDKLISSVKRVFYEAPLRFGHYRNRLKNVLPETTECGTWLDAAFFYAIHLDEIKEVVESFDDENWSIKLAKEALRCECVQQHLSFIYTHFQILSMTMKKLETFELPLTESVDLLVAFMEHLKNVPGDCGKIIAREFKTVQRNGYFDILLEISNILKSAQKNSQRTLVEHWSKFKYAPVTSGDAERFFPAYKLILTDERYRLTTDNIEQTIVTYCNFHYNL